MSPPGLTFMTPSSFFLFFGGSCEPFCKRSDYFEGTMVWGMWRGCVRSEREMFGQPSVILALSSTESWHIIFLTCWLKPWNLGVVCFIVIDNWNNRQKYLFCIHVPLPGMWTQDLQIWENFGDCETKNTYIHTYLSIKDRYTLGPCRRYWAIHTSRLQTALLVTNKGNIMLMFCYLPLNTFRLIQLSYNSWLVDWIPCFSDSCFLKVYLWQDSLFGVYGWYLQSTLGASLRNAQLWSVSTRHVFLTFVRKVARCCCF